MDKNELRQKLNNEKIPISYYNIDGIGEIDQKLCLEHNGNKWLVYYSERGQKFDLSVFDDEEDACKDLYDRITN